MNQIREINKDEYKTLYENMRRDFYASGLAPFSAIKRNLDRNTYDGFYLTDGVSDIGYAIMCSLYLPSFESERWLDYIDVQ